MQDPQGNELADGSVALAQRFFQSYSEADQMIDWIQSIYPVRIAFQMVYKIYLYLIVLPFFHVYIHGPNLGPIGFWSGMSFDQICSKLTNMNDPDFWSSTQENSKRCQMMIMQHFHSFWILALGISYFVLLYFTVKLGIRWFFRFFMSIFTKPKQSIPASSSDRSDK